MTDDEALGIVYGVCRVLSEGDAFGRREYPITAAPFVARALSIIAERGITCEPEAIAFTQDWLESIGVKMIPQMNLSAPPSIPSKHDTAPKPDMSAEEARDCVQQINAKVSHVRALLLDLYERKGWKALGYASWRECAAAEFGKSMSRLYQQLEAAQTEQEISTIVEIGSLNEHQLRNIKEIGTEKVIEQLKPAMSAPNPVEAVKSAVRDIVHKHREEKKAPPDLTPHYGKLGDAAPDAVVAVDTDAAFDGLVAEERRAAILASKKAREYPVSCPCGCGVWSFKSPPPPSRFIPTGGRG